MAGPVCVGVEVANRDEPIGWQPSTEQLHRPDRSRRRGRDERNDRARPHGSEGGVSRRRRDRRPDLADGGGRDRRGARSVTPTWPEPVATGRWGSTMKRPGHARGVKAVSAFLAGLLGLLPTWNAMVFGQTVNPGLAAAVLPSSRSTTVGRAVSAFVTVVNPGSQAIAGIGVFLRSPVPAALTFQTTDPVTNALTGTVNVPVTIGAGQAQTFAIFLTPTAAFPPTLVEFDFGGGVAARVAPIPGVNTLLLSASDAPTPDIVAVAATASRDGILHASVSGALATARATIKTVSGLPFPRRGSFAVAAINA